jgi:hypothetical protein
VTEPLVEDDELLDLAATHEAGHAVMRWLCGWPATRLMAAGNGTGRCEGTGRRVGISDKLRAMLAGPAAEAGYGIFELDWTETRFADFDEARRILGGAFWLIQAGEDVEAAFRRHFGAVCEELWPYADLVEEIAWRLTKQGALSAQAVAALCREYRRRARTVQT